jgi:hypothetical protein
MNVLLHSVIKCHSRTRLAGVVWCCVCVWGMESEREGGMCVCGEIRMSS